MHVRDPGHVPLRDVTVEFVSPGDKSIAWSKQVTHVGHGRDVPRPDRPVRTLGAVGGLFQALPNGGFELPLGLWSEHCGCGGVLWMGLRVGVRVMFECGQLYRENYGCGGGGGVLLSLSLECGQLWVDGWVGG